MLPLLVTSTLLLTELKFVFVLCIVLNAIDATYQWEPLCE